MMASRRKGKSPSEGERLTIVEASPDDPIYKMGYVIGATPLKRFTKKPRAKDGAVKKDS